jgi:hypothetical protein
MLKVVLDGATFPMSALFAPKGSPGSFAAWLHAADEEGLGLVVRGRGKRPRSEGGGLKYQLILISGAGGSTVPWWQWLRDDIGRRRNSMVGLPLGSRCKLYSCGPDGLLLGARDGGHSASAVEAGPAADAEASDEDQDALNSDAEEELVSEMARARLLTAMPIAIVDPRNKNHMDIAEQAMPKFDPPGAPLRWEHLAALCRAAQKLLQASGAWCRDSTSGGLVVREGGVGDPRTPAGRWPGCSHEPARPSGPARAGPGGTIKQSNCPMSQAAPCAECAMTVKSFWEDQLHLALRLGSEHVPLDSPGRILFCVTCMGRQEQLMTSLAINLAITFRWRRRVCWCVVLFGDDRDTWDAIQREFRPFCDAGFLLVASGGDSGRRMAASGSLDAPAWMPPVPGGNSVFEGQVSPPYLHYWHAAWAKNASHIFALWMVRDPLAILVNADCDNLIPAEYTLLLSRAFTRRRGAKGTCVTCRCVEGALTGRLACFAGDFLDVRGYDVEDTMPAASEDVDLRERLLALAVKTEGYKNANEQRPSALGPMVAGTALPNDWLRCDRKWDRNGAKTQRVDPQLLERLQVTPQKAFSKMCEVSWNSILKRRLEEGRIVRNDRGALAQSPGWCAWFTTLCRGQVGRDAAAPPAPGLGAEAEPAPGSGSAASAAASSAASSAIPRAPAAAVRRAIGVRILFGGLRWIKNQKRNALTRRMSRTLLPGSGLKSSRVPLSPPLPPTPHRPRWYRRLVIPWQLMGCHSENRRAVMAVHSGPEGRQAHS